MPDPIQSRDGVRAYNPREPEDLTCQGQSDDTVSNHAEPRSGALPSVRPRLDWVDTDDDLGLSASLLKGRELEHGIELDLFSIGARTSSAEDEGHATLAHLGLSSDDGRRAVRGEILTASARSGTENVDGSVGLHLGAGAAIATAELTLPLGGLGNVTLGATLGVGAVGSIGIADQDLDGKPELCGRVEYLFGIAGLCVENPFAR